MRFGLEDKICGEDTDWDNTSGTLGGLSIPI